METTLSAPTNAINLALLPRADAPTIIGAFRQQFEALRVTAETLEVTDASQVSQMAIARTTRLALRNIRIALDKKRLEMVAGFKKAAKDIDDQARELRVIIEPLETRLLEHEQFAEREEARQKAQLRIDREDALRPFDAEISLYQLDEMSEADFAELLADSKAIHEANVAAIRRAEEDRITREREAAVEAERIRVENARLRAAAIEREAAAEAERQRAARDQRRLEEAARAERERAAAELAAEREAARIREVEAERVAAVERAKVESIARKEREARQRIEAEQRAARQAEEDRLAAKKEEARIAAAAPDKEKLFAFAATVRALTPPTLATEHAQSFNVAHQITLLADWIEYQAEAL